MVQSNGKSFEKSGPPFEVVLNLYAFSANAARVKRQTSMKTKLFCSNRRNQLNVEEVRSANQEREFLALDQS